MIKLEPSKALVYYFYAGRLGTLGRFERNVRRANMKALVLNAVGREFDFDDVDVATPIGREVLVDVRASGLCHTDLLFANNPIFPTPAVFGHEISGIVAEIGP